MTDINDNVDNKVKALSSKKFKVVHFLRHAQGHHNVAGEKLGEEGYCSEEYLDSTLTDLGLSQCSKCCEENFDIVKTSELMIVSPMRRTLQTAFHSFPHCFENENIPILALEHIREQSGLHPCDKRLAKTELEQFYASKSVDFSLIKDVDPLYPKFGNEEREPNHHVVERCVNFISWLKSREEKEIICVTHSAFLRILCNHVLNITEDDKSKFQNCELRTIIISCD
jgi:broad specificity phosphatase PhoE